MNTALRKVEAAQNSSLSASENPPLVPCGNVSSELFQAETNALLRELIGEIERVNDKLDRINENLCDIDRSVCRL
jgi:hypothetical protein